MNSLFMLLVDYSYAFVNILTINFNYNFPLHSLILVNQKSFIKSTQYHRKNIIFISNFSKKIADYHYAYITKMVNSAKAVHMSSF